MVASQDISPGETVLLEDSGPFVACPNLRTNVAVCLECFSPTEASPQEDKSDPYRCPKCSYPLCPECQQLGNVHHSKEECDILSACVARASDDNRVRFFKATGKRTTQPKEIVSDMSAAACEAVYGSVGPLRLLLAAEERKEEYESFIKDFTDNSDLKRKDDSRGWAMVHAVAAGFLRGACKLAERFTAEDVYRAVGMLMTNGVKLECSNGRRRGEGRGGLGLYAAYSLLNHSCLPNTRTKKDAEAGRHALELVAIMPIAKGEEITTRYITPQWDTTR